MVLSNGIDSAKDLRLWGDPGIIGLFIDDDHELIIHEIHHTSFVVP